MTRYSPGVLAERFAIRCLVFAAAAVFTACTTAPPGAGTGSSPASVESSATPHATAAATPSPTPSPKSAIVANFNAGGAGWAMTKAGGALWIQVDPPVDAIVRIDAETGSAVPAVPGGHEAKSGPEGLWVIGGGWLARIDPADGKETLRLPMGGRFALAEGSVWLHNELGVHRIDPETGAVGKPIPPSDSSPCADAKDLAIAFDSAWLACKEGHVVRIDIATGDATTIPTESGAHTFAVTDKAVWVSNYVADSVSRIDPVTNEATTIQGAGRGVGITSGGGHIWAATSHGIAKIDPETATIVDTIPIGLGEYYALVWDEGAIWASTRGIRVLKVDVSNPTP